MLTLNTSSASITNVASSLVRVPVTTPTESRFGQFLSVLLRALATMHV